MNNGMDIQTAHALMCKIIEKAGLFGAIAKTYLGRAETGHEYLLECYDQVHTMDAKEFWDSELIKDILDYKPGFGGGADSQHEGMKFYRSSQY